MNQSLFLEFVQSWFPKLSNIVSKVNDKRKNTLTYLHKTMLRNEYSVDQKWESASVNTTYVAADVVSMDSELPLKRRDSLAAANGKLPKVGMKVRLGEEDINNINLMKAKGTNFAQVVAKMSADAVRCVTGVDERNEATFLRGLSEGITLVEDEDNVGVGIRVNYNYLDANKYGVAVKWGEAGFTPVSDIAHVLSKISDDQNDCTVIALSLAQYNLMRRSDEGRQLAANYASQVVLENSVLPVPTPAKFDEAFAAEYGGVKFLKINRTVTIEKDGKRKKIRPWNDNKIIFLPSEEVGALVYGTLAEETNPVTGVMYTKANEYVLVSKYSKNDPLQEYTSSQALCLPVIEGVDEIYQMDVTEAQAVDPTKEALDTDDTKVSVWDETYTKAEVIAALNEMGYKTSALIGDAKLIARINELSDEEEAKLKESLTPVS